MLISKKLLANRWCIVPRTLDRRKETDPELPKSRVINGRHYYEIDEIERYEKHLANRPQVRRAAPVNRPGTSKRVSADSAPAHNTGISATSAARNTA